MKKILAPLTLILCAWTFEAGASAYTDTAVAGRREAGVPVEMNVNKRVMTLPWEPRDIRLADEHVGYMENRSTHVIRHWVLGPGDHIIFYVDTLIEQPWRDAIKNGLLRWNEAFKAIGLGDVVEAFDYPKDIDVGGGDYNVVRYIAADRENAEGVFWFDPRSGEIGRGEIYWWAGVIKKLRLWLFTQTAGAWDATRGSIPDSIMCEAVSYAAAHEMGHVLGLKHNMRGSFAIPTDSLRSPSFTAVWGTTASIMDYARFNFVAQSEDILRGVNMFPPHIGEYDKLAVRFAYGKKKKNLFRQVKGNDMLAYKGNIVSAKPTDPSAQPVMLGNDILLSTRYAVVNLRRLVRNIDQWLPDTSLFSKDEAISEIVSLFTRLTTLCEANIGGSYVDTYGDTVYVAPEKQNETKVFLNEQLETWREWLPENGKMKKWEREMKSVLYGGVMALDLNLNPRVRQSVVALTRSDSPYSPFATATFINDNGLLLSCYHPLIRYIARLGDESHDYLKEGYSGDEVGVELPLPGLCVSQLIKMEDVTKEMAQGDDPEDIINRHKGGGGDLRGRISAMNGDSLYILNITRIYRDVRLVAAPSNTLGKFGGEDDNWQWPRTTVDAAFIRVYVDTLGETADYSPGNAPLTGNTFLDLSDRVIWEGEEVSTVGYPTRTKMYIPSFALEYMRDREIPAQIALDKSKIEIIGNAHGGGSRAEYIYSPALASLWNDRLKQEGLLKGLTESDVIEKRKEQERELTSWINSDEERLKKYGGVMKRQAEIYDSLIPYKIAEHYFKEAVVNGSQVIPFAGKFEKLARMFRPGKVDMAAARREAERLKQIASAFYRYWDYDVSRDMYAAMLERYTAGVDSQFLSREITDAIKESGGDMDAYADSVFRVSIITHRDSMDAFLKNVDSVNVLRLTDDPVYKVAISFYSAYVRKVSRRLTALYKRQADEYSLYMNALSGMRRFLTPDANKTQRCSSGKVLGRTTMRDMLDKYDAHTGDARYSLSERELSVLKASQGRDESPTPQGAAGGKSAKGAAAGVCFETSCKTSGGSSGSPVLNSSDEVIGITFDREASSVIGEFTPEDIDTRAIAADINAVRAFFPAQTLRR